ncbi:MAG: hypothetical protein ACE5Q6_20660, partial [Dehalococcoidia bacterium]
EGQLMRRVRLNLSHSRYIGYDLEEAVPDHSTKPEPFGQEALSAAKECKKGTARLHLPSESSAAWLFGEAPLAP